MTLTNTLSECLAAHPRANLIQVPAIIHKLPRLSSQFGHEIYILREDLTGFGLGGNKTRKVDFLLFFIPFILMTVIVTMLLVMFGLDPMTGRRSKPWKRRRERKRRPAYPWGPDRAPTDAEKRTEWIFSGDNSGQKEESDYYRQMSEQQLRDRADRANTRRGDMRADVRAAVDSEIGTQGGRTTHFPRGSRLIDRDARRAVDFEVGRPILPHRHRILYAQNNI